VLDDIEQQITDIVRGSDLLEVTTRQLTLFKYLNMPAPRYLHLPLAVNAAGLKLSKQNHAMALDMNNPKVQLLNALRFLGQAVNEQYQDFTIEQLLISATTNWQISKIPLSVSSSG
jgi:glutamyl-Q tRNA(Asp) synthetase